MLEPCSIACFFMPKARSGSGLAQPRNSVALKHCLEAETKTRCLDGAQNRGTYTGEIGKRAGMGTGTPGVDSPLNS